MISSTPRLHFTPGKDPVPILQEAECAPGLVLTGGKSRPHQDSIPDHPGGSQSLYRLSYLAHLDISEKRKISCPCQDLALESFSQQPTHIYYTICILYHNGAIPLFTLYAFMVCMGTTFHILPSLHLYHKDGRLIHYSKNMNVMNSTLTRKFQSYQNTCTPASSLYEHLHACQNNKISIILSMKHCISFHISFQNFLLIIPLITRNHCKPCIKL